MANIKTRALTEGEYSIIIQTIQEGFKTADNRQIKPNLRIATALVVQANLGLRIGDIVNLKLSDIIKDGARYRLDIIGQKTNKVREFTIPNEIYTYLQSYSLDNNIKTSQRLFAITVRQIQKHLKIVTEYLGLESVGTHSFRKFFAVSIYNENDFNIELVRQLLQHSSVAVTQKYISVQPQIVGKALQNHIKLPA